ncbi:hypothetical protein BD311DRAFT_663502 [Dichomitus squalens]|uniref:Uncharacterized protein n=1 Tax=Dichomitus squalens TaxID=114155 RepID=A0A4Q9MQC6_9APHY|nr:hypothetical protein BD311DRAFT_663502 [Dichomitus squalens]
MILLIRIVAVYPLYRQSLRKNIIIYGVLVTILTGRLVNIGFFVRRLLNALRTSENAFVAWTSPYIKAELFSQLRYDLYASILFLVRLRQGGALQHRAGTSVPYTQGARSSYRDRLRTLFWMSTSNFVIPNIFNIILIISTFRSANPFFTTYISTIHVYVEIVSVLLATIWCSGKYWQRNAPENVVMDGNVVESLDSVTFAPPIDLACHSSSEMMVLDGKQKTHPVV